MTKYIKMESVNKAEDVEALFQQYLDICNQAIEKHKGEFPYQQVLSFGEKFMGERPIDIAIYDDEPKATFCVYFKGNQLKNDGQPNDAKKAWRVNLGYLRQVVNHPNEVY